MAPNAGRRHARRSINSIPLAGEAGEISGTWIVNDDDAQQVSRHSRHLDLCRRQSALALKPIPDSVERASA
jgi:predicted ATPase